MVQALNYWSWDQWFESGLPPPGTLSGFQGKKVYINRTTIVYACIRNLNEFQT